ncbi:MAG: glucokinase [Burkholderiaceae bacterium]
MTAPRLLGDIGATNARFALLHPGHSAPCALAVLKCVEHPTLFDAIRSYLARQAPAAPRFGAIGIATPVLDDRVSMTNHPWSFSIRELQAALRMERLVVINDFTALALALPLLQAHELHGIGPGQARPGAPKAVLGPGTGLGVSALIGRGDDFVPLAGEGGHVTLSATDEAEDAVIAKLRERFGHASAERALSGPGLVNLYTACCEIAGRKPLPLDPEQISALALSDADPICRRAVELFFALLGTTAGNLALTLGALGGVYIGGGIVPRLMALIDASPFRTRFEAKGRYADYLRDIPTWVIVSEVSPALLGAARALDMALSE